MRARFESHWVAALVLVAMALAGCLVTPTATASSPPKAAAAASLSTAFVPITPARLVDTRSGTGVRRGRVAARSTVTFAVTGTHGVPADASTVILNLTAVTPGADGYASAYPGGAPRPATSNLNYMRGRTTAGQVYVAPSTGGRVTVYSYAATDLVVDVEGYTPGGSTGYRPVTASRLLDTRSGTAIGPKAARSLRVTGVAGVPSSGVAAVVLSVAATRSAGAGYVNLYPHGVAQPRTSNLNTAAGQTESALVVVKPGAGGLVDLYSYARTDLVVDVAGWVADASSYVAITPRRLLDSRTQPYEGATDGGIDVAVPVPDGAVAAQVVVTAVGRPAHHLDSGSGYFTAGPQGLMTATSQQAQPTWSTVNFAPAQTSSNSVFVKIGANHQIVLDGYNIWKSDVLVDVVGYVRQPTTKAVTAASPTSVPRQFIQKVICFAGGGCASMDRYGSVFFTTASGAWTRTDTGASWLANLACASMTACVASNGVAMFSWDGSTWTKGSQIVLAGEVTMSCPTASRCVAATEKGSYESTDLKSWTPIVGIPALSDPVVACRSEASCSIVDSTGAQYDFDGTHWTHVPGAPAGIVTMACAMSGCEAAAKGGRTWGYDDGTWTAQATLQLPADGAPRLSCAPTGRCVLVDGSVVATEESGHWTSSTSPAPDGLGYPSCPDSTCTAVSAHGEFWNYDGSVWSAAAMATLPRWVGVVDLNCPSSTFCLAGDSWGDVRTASGGIWWAASAIDPAESLADSSTGCVDESHCLAVDFTQHAVREWSPQAGWTKESGQAWTPAHALRCTTGVGCVVADTAQVLHRWNGSTWSTTAALGFAATAVSCPATSYCVAADQSGQFAVWAAGSWTRHDMRLQGDLRLDSVDCTSPTRCVATASGGVAVAWDGRSWAIDQIGEGTALQAGDRVFCDPGHQCVTLADERLQVWDGARWFSSSVGLVDATDLTCAGSACVEFNEGTVMPFSY